MMETIDKVALAPIIDRKVLFVRSRGQDLFYTLGGKREGKESDFEAARREVGQEVGVEIDAKTFKYFATFTSQAHGKPDGVMVRLTCYLVSLIGTPQPASEIEELAWFTSRDEARTTETGRSVLAWLKENDLID